LLLSEWDKTKVEFIQFCEKYSHQYGRLKSLSLAEVIGSKNGDKCFRYKAKFSHSDEVVEIRVFTNPEYKYNEITLIKKWYEKFK
jgi:hypothetical protein